MKWRYVNVLWIKEAEAEQKLEILNWISAVIGEPIDTKEPFEKVLKDGVILCKYAYYCYWLSSCFLYRPSLFLLCDHPNRPYKCIGLPIVSTKGRRSRSRCHRTSEVGITKWTATWNVTARRRMSLLARHSYIISDLLKQAVQFSTIFYVVRPIIIMDELVHATICCLQLATETKCCWQFRNILSFMLWDRKRRSSLLQFDVEIRKSHLSLTGPRLLCCGRSDWWTSWSPATSKRSTRRAGTLRWWRTSPPFRRAWDSTESRRMNCSNRSTCSKLATSRLSLRALPHSLERYRPTVYYSCCQQCCRQHFRRSL